MSVERPAVVPQDSLTEDVSHALQEIGVEHVITVKPRYQIERGHTEQHIDHSIRGITTFRSVRDFAAALEAAGADASYSAGSGWHFTRRPT